MIEITSLFFFQIIDTLKRLIIEENLRKKTSLGPSLSLHLRTNFSGCVQVTLKFLINSSMLQEKFLETKFASEDCKKDL